MSVYQLEAKNIYKNFIQGEKPLEVLSGIDFSFYQGKSYAITGVSGSGKSTLLHILGGLDVPSKGTVLFNQKDLFKLRSRKKEKFLNKELGFVFQFHHLIKELSVLENIMLPGLIKGDSRGFCKKRAKTLLKQVGLTGKVDSYPTELSGGEQQRVSILRAIFNQPAFLLADEPTGDLDADNAAKIVDLLKACQKEFGTGLIICSHDYAVYNQMETVLRLHDGLLDVEK